jgi:hypothetical protein
MQARALSHESLQLFVPVPEPTFSRSPKRRTLRDFVHLLEIFVHDKTLVPAGPPVYSVIPTKRSHPTPSEAFLRSLAVGTDPDSAD